MFVCLNKILVIFVHFWTLLLWKCMWYSTTWFFNFFLLMYMYSCAQDLYIFLHVAVINFHTDLGLSILHLNIWKISRCVYKKSSQASPRAGSRYWPLLGFREALLSLCQATGLSSPLRVTNSSWFASDFLILALTVLCPRSPFSHGQTILVGDPVITFFHVLSSAFNLSLLIEFLPLCAHGTVLLFQPGFWILSAQYF